MTFEYSEDIEEGTGFTEEELYNRFGIEITPPCVGETALILSGDLFAVYDVPEDIPSVVADINYIIQEEIF